ncbi:biotin-dependent carboxyltransferase family protein [Devosia sp. SD17-2]|uniref:5-oxoprolinase subunit C family protein n=1 Tax=Devosia sp. SD17-2 TaxID=2976459 RepID=UPI0023D86E85|nr:biotin-dependent carboxyltransferase family protein [Devosia sp. SD17-2]WEJ31402.1 biotin-dependent carboxyltransferase family protein [Devosia sp. SD17-2]
MTRLRIDRAGPLVSLQDPGRFGMLSHGISASGPMDTKSFARAGRWAGASDASGVEFTMAGLDLTVLDGETFAGWDGGGFTIGLNGELLDWPGQTRLVAGDRLTISAGPYGNYGYLRFGGRLEVKPVLGSIATSTRARLGGLSGKTLAAGDELVLEGEGGEPQAPEPIAVDEGPIRFVWGLHAEMFSPDVRQAFVAAEFRTTPTMDRMGVRLGDPGGVFANEKILSLVSDPVVSGDIQILGDGTPIVLMRDHQPTGGYPRIGTVISVDLSRFAQIRPNRAVSFTPVSLANAHRILRSQLP